MRWTSKTNITLVVGVLLVVAGLIALTTTEVSTLVMCRTYAGYQINSIILTTVSYYDGCNWITVSSVVLAAPTGAAVFVVGIVFKSYHIASELVRT